MTWGSDGPDAPEVFPWGNLVAFIAILGTIAWIWWG